jgi:hypothetical protein
MATQLLQAFKQASELFNAGKYDELGAMLSSNVILKRVGDPGSIVGIGNVLGYLNTHQKSQQPQFLNDRIQAQIEKATQGIIGGTAEYRNKPGDRETIPVQFTFVFVRNDPNDDWMLTNLFAVPTK